MQLYAGFQSLVPLVIGVVALGCEVFAFVDALRHPENAYVAAEQAHQALLARDHSEWPSRLGFVTVFNPLGLFGLPAFVGAAVYLADVRPGAAPGRGLGGPLEHGW